MADKHKHRRRGKAPEDGTRITSAAEKRVRREDRRHRCHARCECVRTTAGDAARGCCSGSTVLILGVLAALIIALAAITGKL